MATNIEITSAWQSVSDTKCIITIQSNGSGNLYFNDASSDAGQKFFSAPIFTPFIQTDAKTTYMRCDAEGVGTFIINVEDNL